MKTIGKRKIIAVILSLAAVIMVFAALASGAFASSLTVESGRSFTALESIAQSGVYDTFPGTVEAWVKFPSATDAAGVIFSNYREAYNGAKYGVSFELAENAQPRILIDNGDHTFDIKFASVSGAGEWVHIAFVSDAEAGAFTCYVNGAEIGKDTTSMATAVSEGVYTERPFIVGGSYERNNTKYFKGEINSLAVFSDMRSSSEVAYDYSAGIPNTEEGLISKYDFSAAADSYTDLSGNGFDLTDRTFLTKEEYLPKTDFAYSFAIIGDTQRLVEKYPDKYHAMYEWLVANAEKEKIEVVLGMGDVTEQSLVTQWEDALLAHKLLEAAGIPYQLTRGNHDMKNTNPADSTRVGMNDVFGVYAPYMAQFEGSFAEGDATNTYFTKKIGEVDYLFLALDYGASDAMLEWANGVVASHPDHKVIVSTHGYEYYSGKKLGFDANKGTIPAASNDYEFSKYSDNPNTRDYNSAVDMWNDFASKHGNIMLILSGHEGSENIIYHTEEGVHGNDVSSFLINPQGIDGTDKYQGLGMVCLFKFSNDGKEIYIEYYSTAKEKYFRMQNQITLTVSDDSYEEHNIERYSLHSSADCENNAKKSGVCVDCGYVHTVEIEGTKLDHAVSAYAPESAAGCESNATESGTCSICDKKVTRERPNTATGHEYESGECKTCHAEEPEN